MDITAGTEITAVAGKNYGLHIIRINHITKDITQLGIAFKSQWIFAVGPVQPDDRDFAIHLP